MSTYNEVVNSAMTFDDQTFLYTGVESNILMVRDWVASEEIDVSEEHLRWAPGAIQDIAKRLAAQGKLAHNTRYLATISALHTAYPMLSRTAANDLAFVRASQKYRVDFANVEQMVLLIAENDVWRTLSVSNEAREETAANLQRDRQIAEMTANGSKNFSIRTENGNWRRFNPEGFELQASSSGGFRKVGTGFANLSPEEVNILYVQWRTERDFKAMSKEDLAKIVRENAKNAYIEKYGTDPNTHKVPEPGYVEPYAAVVNPFTGEEIKDKKSLCKYLGSHPNAAKAMLQNARGETKPDVKRNFEFIINGGVLK